MNEQRLMPGVVAIALGVGVSGCYDGLPASGDELVGDTDVGAASTDDGAGEPDSGPRREPPETGEVSGGSQGGEDDTAPGEESDSGETQSCETGVPLRPLHRLTPRQYRNTIRDLFGVEAFDLGYDDEAPVITELGVRQLRASAEDLMTQRETWSAEVFPCDLAAERDDACVETFLRGFGSRVLRRPLTEDEVAQWTAVYLSAIEAEMPFGDAMEVLLTTLLQSPEFVYLVERGIPTTEESADVLPLSGYEIANRLSYLLWDTMPDDVLFSAAQSGELATAEGIATQAARMLAAPLAEEKLQGFFSDWLQLDGGQLHFSLEETRKDEALFPEFQPALRESMRTELEAFVRDIMQDENGASFERLFTDRSAYVNASLAAIYGVEGPADDETWMWVQLDETQRAGLLTRAAFLSVFATAASQAPIRRGVFVIEELLCAEMPDPPPDVNDAPVEGGGEAEDENGETVLRTVREEVTARTGDSECASCHSLINPVGFLFEHYDAIGRWQDQEVVSGRPVDASGALTLGDVAGPLPNAVALSESLATSAMVRSCFAERWITRAFDTSLEELDACGQNEPVEAFVTTGDIGALLTQIVVSDAFRQINISEVGSP